MLGQRDEQMLDADVLILERPHFLLGLAKDRVQIVGDDQLTSRDAARNLGKPVDLLFDL